MDFLQILELIKDPSKIDDFMREVIVPNRLSPKVYEYISNYLKRNISILANQSVTDRIINKSKHISMFLIKEITQDAENQKMKGTVVLSLDESEEWTRSFIL